MISISQIRIECLWVIKTMTNTSKPALPAQRLWARVWRPKASDIPADKLAVIVDSIKTAEHLKAYQEAKEIDRRLRIRPLADPANWRAAMILVGSVLFLGFFFSSIWPLLKDQQKLKAEIADLTNEKLKAVHGQAIADKDKAIAEKINELVKLADEQRRLAADIENKQQEIKARSAELADAQNKLGEVLRQSADYKSSLDHLTLKNQEVDLAVLRIEELRTTVGDTDKTSARLEAIDKGLADLKKLRTQTGEILQKDLERRQLTGTSWLSENPSVALTLSRFVEGSRLREHGRPHSVHLFIGADGLAVIRVTFMTSGGQFSMITESLLALWQLGDDIIEIVSLPRRAPMMHIDRKITKDHFRHFRDGLQYGPVRFEARVVNGPSGEFKRWGLDPQRGQ